MKDAALVSATDSVVPPGVSVACTEDPSVACTEDPSVACTVDLTVASSEDPLLVAVVPSSAVEVGIVPPDSRGVDCVSVAVLSSVVEVSSLAPLS